MKRLVFCALALLIGSHFWAVAPPEADAARGIKLVKELSHESGKLGAYRALIIGINDYQDPKIPDLNTALRDAKAMAKVLRERYGFHVDLLLDRDATKKAMFEALRKLVVLGKPDDSTLIYYAGHGDLDRVYKDGWWVPADAEVGNPVTYFDNVQVQKAMRNTKARHVLLISDSCYSGTLFGQGRTLPPKITNKYYLSLYRERSRWGMTSGNKEPVSDRGTKGHSVFAYHLLKVLRESKSPYLSTQELYTKIAPIVSNNAEQTPLCRPIRNTGDQGGEFVFVAVRPQEQVRIAGGSHSSSSIEAERKRIALERTRLEAERKRLDEEKRLLEERWKLAEERQQLASEKAKLEAKRKRLAEKEHRYEVKKGSTEEPQQLARDQAKLKAEREPILEKRPQLEETKKQQVASLPPKPSVSKPKVIEREGDFVKYDNGVVKDTKTGLEWVAGPDNEMNWEEAGNWVTTLKIAGGGWRIPTDKELKNLYKKGKGNRKLASLLKVSRRNIWTDDFPAEVEVLISHYKNNELEQANVRSLYYDTIRKWALVVRSR